MDHGPARTATQARRRRGLLNALLNGNFGGLIVDGELDVPPELEVEFAAERRVEAAARRAQIPTPRQG